MVGAVRFELTTSCTRNKRASQATLRPDLRARQDAASGTGMQPGIAPGIASGIAAGGHSTSPWRDPGGAGVAECWSVGPAKPSMPNVLPISESASIRGSPNFGLRTLNLEL